LMLQTGAALWERRWYLKWLQSEEGRLRWTVSKFQDGAHFNIAIRLYQLRGQVRICQKLHKALTLCGLRTSEAPVNSTTLSLYARAPTPTPPEAFWLAVFQVAGYFGSWCKIFLQGWDLPARQLGILSVFLNSSLCENERFLCYIPGGGVDFGMEAAALFGPPSLSDPRPVSDPSGLYVTLDTVSGLSVMHTALKEGNSHLHGPRMMWFTSHSRTTPVETERDLESPSLAGNPERHFAQFFEGCLQALQPGRPVFQSPLAFLSHPTNAHKLASPCPKSIGSPAHSRHLSLAWQVLPPDNK
jgi:hypothetical protein